MGKYFFAALLAGAAMPAQALQLITYIDMTETTIYDIGWEESQSVGIVPLVFSGNDLSFISASGGDKAPFLVYQCPECLIASPSGNKLVFDLRPELFLFGSYTLELNFDQPVASDLSNLAMLSLVSGNLSVWGTGRYFPISHVSGPVMSFAVNVPEPATWGLMIGGFALAGGAMRRRNYRVSFA